VPKPAETVLQEQELQAVLEPLRAELLRIPGCNSNGIGLTAAAFQRLRGDGGEPEAVRPADSTISVGFESDEAFTAGARRVHEMLRDAPHDCSVGGRIVVL
jgi:hypothetical protein